MASINLDQSSHRRFNSLTGEWVLVSPHRTKRPWLGQVEEISAQHQPSYDPTCYLCPGNERAGGVHNPRYDSTYVFDNDYPALLPNPVTSTVNEKDLIIAESESGICRVVCFSPRHDLTLAAMSRPEIRNVVDVWAEQFIDLGNRASINYVQIFENRGAAMGASNPHPHCQIWASSSLPNEPQKEQATMRKYSESHDQCLLCEYLSYEARSERLVLQNRHFQAVVPFWAVWPFETIVIATRHVADLSALDSAEREGLADILGKLTAGYDRIFNISFPYSMGFHQRPTDGRDHPEWHLHAHFFPPLLRSATVRKFMVGFEMLGTPQRDITAEAAAARLREVV